MRSERDKLHLQNHGDLLGLAWVHFQTQSTVNGDLIQNDFMPVFVN